MASAALIGAMALAGCQTEGNFPSSSRANAPIPPKLLAEISDKNMDVSSPILVRAFKSESELEVWKKDRSGRYALLKTYPICKWSGDLGPKIREGDRQAPEGFYEITPGQMNPNSQFHLAFNLGYPNAFDRAHDRTGSHLMVHGDCSSRGCYAMTDEQIQEIFALGRESFFGGQKSFQVQAYPFRMTPANMAKHRNNPHMPFWRMLKEGNDHFELTRLEPKVDVCEKRYVFNAAAPGGNFTPMPFNPKGKCPVYEVPQEIASAVQAKQRSDEMQIAQLAARGTPTAPIRSGRDGGMHPTFVARLQPREIVDERGNTKLVVDRSNLTRAASFSAPQIDSPRYEAEPINTASVVAEEPAPVAVAAADVPLPRNAPQPKVGTRPAEATFAEKLGNFFRIGPNRQQTAPATRVASTDPSVPAVAAQSRDTSGARAMPRPVNLRGTNDQPQASESSANRATRDARRPATETPRPPAAVAAQRPLPTPAPQPAPAPAAQANAAPPATGQMSGSQPLPAPSSFDNSWSSLR